jgi:hypothetical protein
METFPMPRSKWAFLFLALFAPRGGSVTLGDASLIVRMGALGRAEVPISMISRVSVANWSWWQGLGVRIHRGEVGFIAQSGRVVALDLSAPLAVRAPFRWMADRVSVRVMNPEELVLAIAVRRERLSAPD